MCILDLTDPNVRTKLCQYKIIYRERPAENLQEQPIAKTQNTKISLTGTEAASPHRHLYAWI